MTRDDQAAPRGPLQLPLQVERPVLPGDWHRGQTYEQFAAAMRARGFYVINPRAQLLLVRVH